MNEYWFEMPLMYIILQQEFLDFILYRHHRFLRLEKTKQNVKRQKIVQ